MLINTANATRDALREEIAKLQTELGLPVSKTSKLRKAELVEIADELQQAALVGQVTEEDLELAQAATRALFETQDEQEDEDDTTPRTAPVVGYEGTPFDAAWLRQMGLDHDPAEDDANDAAIRAQYATAAEMVELGLDNQEDREVIEFVRDVARTLDQLPVTETDIASARIECVVQIGSRLATGTLISVVNRRTRFLHPVLATVEVEGVRRLINADDLLVA